MLKHGHNRRGEPSKTYSTWASMMQRCYDKNHKSYKIYGDRGIGVAREWRKFENFLADMGEKPVGITLERIDNDKGYCNSNCKWATYSEQNKNKRNAHLLTYKGETKNLSDWAEIIGVNRDTLFSRIKARFTSEQVIEHRLYANKR